MVDARRVVVAATGGVRESVVGVVYELEFAGAFTSFGRVRGDAVRMGFERSSVWILLLATHFYRKGRKGREMGGTVCKHLGSAAVLLSRLFLTLHLRCC